MQRSRVASIFKNIKRVGWELIPWALLCLIIVSTCAGYKVYETAEETRASMVEVRDAAGRMNRFLTEERMIEQAARLEHSNDALQIMANTYSEVGYSTKSVLDEHVAPAVDLLSVSVDQRMRSMDRKVSEFLDVASIQIGRNGQALYDNQVKIGDSINASVVSFNRRLNASEIDQMLTDLAAAGHNVRVVTEDPEIARMLDESSRLVTNAADTAGNLAGTTKSVERYVDTKLFPPPPKGFWNKFKHGLKVTVQWVALGGSAVYPLIRIAQ
jgi:type IV secretory pathway TrbF-like protein